MSRNNSNSSAKNIDRGGFPETRWSVIQHVGGSDGAAKEEALKFLCEAYHGPVYVFARGSGKNVEEAEDLTQGFFLHIIRSSFFAKANPEKGRLRSFLLMSFKNFMRSAERSRSREPMEDGIDIDAEDCERWLQEELATDIGPDKLFDLRWTLTVMERVFDRLRSEFAKSGEKEALFDSLKAYLQGRSTQTLGEVALEHGLTEGSVKMTAHRLRKQYAKLFRNEVADTLLAPTDEAVEEEIRAIKSSLHLSSED